MMERWDVKGCRVAEKMQQGVQDLHSNMGNHLNYLINTGFFWQSPSCRPFTRYVSYEAKVLPYHPFRPSARSQKLGFCGSAGITHRLSISQGGGCWAFRGSPVAGKSR